MSQVAAVCGGKRSGVRSAPSCSENVFGKVGRMGVSGAHLSDTMHSLISFRKSTPPQNRQLKILINNSKRRVDDLVGELTF